MSQSVTMPTMASPAAASRVDPADARVDLAQLGTALRRRWRWIAFPTLLAFIGSIVFVNVVSPRYTGEAKLLLQSADTFYTRGGNERLDQQIFDEQAVASQVQVVMSRDLAREAIRRLGLVGNPEFDPMVNGVGLVMRIGILLGFAKNPLDRPPEERVLDRYFERLQVFPVGKSRIVAVEFRSRDPDLAARAATTIAELYLNLQNEAKQDTARSASTWLGTNIDGLRERVAQSEARVEAFRARTGLFAGTNNTTLVNQTLSELTAQLAQARSTQTDTEARAKLIRDLIRNGRAVEIPDVANNELVRRLFEQRVSLRTQLALESRTLLPGHPRIKELNAQLADLETQIRSAAERVVRTLENDSRIAGSRVESINATIEAQKKVVVGANENEVQLRALEREARTQREQLESYLGRYREASARESENATPPDARIVSRAVAPQDPSFPKKLPIILLSTLAVMMVSCGIILGRQLLGGRPGDPAPFPSERAVEPVAAPLVPAAAPRWPEPAMAPVSRPGTAALAEPIPDPAPAIQPAPEPMPSVQDEAAAELARRYDFSSLSERLQRVSVAERGRRLLITGVESEADAAAVARGLARHLARDDRTILIDLDSSEEISGLPVFGFTDLISGDASFMDVIEREAGSRLHRVTLGTHEAQLLGGEGDGIGLSLSAFDQTYEWVVCLVRNARSPAFDAVALRVDVVVIASNHEPAARDLVAAYETAKNAGAPEVVVAREQGMPSETRQAA